MENEQYNIMNARERTEQDDGNWLDRHHLGCLNMFFCPLLWHRRQETEELALGRPVEIEELNTNWPRPWLWSRALALFALCFALLYSCWILEGMGAESKLLPGLTIIGSLAFPLSMLLFFFEVNKFRTVSLLRALYYFVAGSCVSVVITFVLTTLLDYLPFAVGGSPQLKFVAAQFAEQRILFASLFEELGKTVVIFLFLMHFRKHCYILQGLLIGAAVGAGFAVFESAGCAFSGSSSLLSSILMRNLAAPACHTAWGAIMGGGLMLITKRNLSYAKLFSPKFWLLFIFVWALHFAWNYALDTVTDAVFQH